MSQLQEAISIVLNWPLNDLDLGICGLVNDLQSSQLNITLKLKRPPFGIIVKTMQQVVTVQIAPLITLLLIVLLYPYCLLMTLFTILWQVLDTTGRHRIVCNNWAWWISPTQCCPRLTPRRVDLWVWPHPSRALRSFCFLMCHSNSLNEWKRRKDL